MKSGVEPQTREVFMHIAPRFLLNLITTSIICAAFTVAQTPSTRGPKAALPKSNTVIIRGVLLKQDKTPWASKPPFEMVLLTVAPVEGEGEKGTNVSISTESLNKHSAQPNAQGRFTIKVDRAALPAGKEFIVLSLIPGIAGLQPLKLEGKPVSFKIDDKTTVINLGTIIVADK